MIEKEQLAKFVERLEVVSQDSQNRAKTADDSHLKGMREGYADAFQLCADWLRGEFRLEDEETTP